MHNDPDLDPPFTYDCPVRVLHSIAGIFFFLYNDFTECKSELFWLAWRRLVQVDENGSGRVDSSRHTAAQSLKVSRHSPIVIDQCTVFYLEIPVH